MAFIQATVTLYVFIAILIMIYKGLTMYPDNNYMDKVRHRALVWPLEVIFIIRRLIMFYNLSRTLNVFKNKDKDLDVDIQEVVFWVADDDKSNVVHKEVTSVVKMNGENHD